MPWQVACPQPLLSLRTFLASRPVALRRRSFSSEAAGGRGGAETADHRLQLLFQGGPALCLERAVGDRAGLDAQLWGTGAFCAEVYPDLPVATSWQELVRLAGGGAAPAPAPEAPAAAPAAAGSRWRVQTVAAQCRSREQLRSLVMEATGVDAEGEPQPGARPADALLCVSGSHPVRALPGATRWLQSSFDTLAMAGAMREQGRLPASLSLWAVENPMAAPPSRLEAKAAAGAEAVLTQPPLLWPQSERWAREAYALGVSKRVRVVMGVALASSAGNLDFWLRLAGVRGAPEAAALLAAFPTPEALGSKEACAAAVKAWNVDLIERTLSLPGVAGLHVMPLTPAARRLALELLADGTLPRGAGSNADFEK